MPFNISKGLGIKGGAVEIPLRVAEVVLMAVSVKSTGSVAKGETAVEAVSGGADTLAMAVLEVVVPELVILTDGAA